VQPSKSFGYIKVTCSILILGLKVLIQKGGVVSMGTKALYNEIIQFAIDKEQEAIDLYSDMAKRARSTSGKLLFQELASMENGHKTKLQKLDMSYFASQKIRSVEDLKIADYLIDVPLKPDSTYQDILLYAAKREKLSFNLYTDLAHAYATVADIRKIFEVLAQEEATHKLRLEREYDENVYKEN
jgi:rubrerythrin